MKSFLNRLLVGIAFLGPVLALAQNTIGGQKVIVAEAEVDRQSEFVDAEKARLLGHYDKAIERYKKFLYDNPGIDAAWYGLARSYDGIEDLPNALESIEKALAADPVNKWYREFQAYAFQKADRPKDAALVYDKLSREYPKDTDYLRHLAYLSVLSEDPKMALKTLDRLEVLTGVSEETAEKKHLIYVNLGDIKKAAQELQKLVDTYPDHVAYRRRLAAFYEDNGDQAAAQKTYAEILKINPNDPLAGVKVLNKGKTSSDQAYLNSLKPLAANPQVSIDTKIKEILPYLASSSRTLQDTALVATLLEVCNLIEKAHPNDARALSLTGAVLYQSNRHADALEKYRQCLKLNPNIFSAWENTLAILQELKKYDEMLRVAEQAMDAFPNQPKAYYYYGVAATEKGKYEEALSQLEQAALMTTNPSVLTEVLDQKGLTLLRKKDVAAAIVTFEQAIAKSGAKNPLLLEHYGDALYQSGNKTGASANWQKAYDITKDPAILQKIKSI